MIRHPGAGAKKLFPNYFRCPDNTICVPVTFDRMNCGKGLAKNFTSLKDSHTNASNEQCR